MTPNTIHPLRKGRSMRALVLFGNLFAAGMFFMPGCWKEAPSPQGPPPQQQSKMDWGFGLAQGAPAPEIEGQDADGNAFKLSDFKGKVVMLDFWADFCAPCKAMFPHNRDLVDRYKDRPFVLLGVNLDQDQQVMKRSVERYGLNWRNWWDPSGNISRKYRVQYIPTIYLIDANGNLQAKPNNGEPGFLQNIDTTIERLVREAEGKV